MNRLDPSGLYAVYLCKSRKDVEMIAWKQTPPFPTWFLLRNLN